MAAKQLHSRHVAKQRRPLPSWCELNERLLANMRICLRAGRSSHRNPGAKAASDSCCSPAAPAWCPSTPRRRGQRWRALAIRRVLTCSTAQVNAVWPRSLRVDAPTLLAKTVAQSTSSSEKRVLRAQWGRARRWKGVAVAQNSRLTTAINRASSAGAKYTAAILSLLVSSSRPLTDSKG